MVGHELFTAVSVLGIGGGAFLLGQASMIVGPQDRSAPRRNLGFAVIMAGLFALALTTL